MDNIRFLVEGKEYKGFKDLTLTRSVEAISSYFSFTFADNFNRNERWPLSPQDKVEIFIGETPLVNGFIDVLTGSLEADNRTYTVQGRDRTSDLVDCSLTDGKTNYTNIRFQQLCTEIAKRFDIPFYLGPGRFKDGPMNFAMQVGDTVFENLDRAANRVGALLVPDGLGGLIITTQGSVRSSVDLIEGYNFKSIEFKRDFTKRFSDYVVEGRQRSPKSAKDAETWFGPTKGKGGPSSVPRAGRDDPNIRRYRPILIRPSGNLSSIEADSIVGFEVATRIANSLEINVTVEGWHQSKGRPWTINELVKVYAPRLGIGNEVSSEYLIADTTYSLNDKDGRTTQMRLVPKDAYLNPIIIEKKEKDKPGQGKAWFEDNQKGSVRAYVPKKQPVKQTDKTDNRSR